MEAGLFFLFLTLLVNVLVNTSQGVLQEVSSFDYSVVGKWMWVFRSSLTLLKNP